MLDYSFFQPAVSVSGEFNIFTAHSYKQLLLDAIKQSETLEIDVDLSAVTEIDLAGLQLMIMAKKEAARIGRVLRFCGHAAPVLALVDLCGLSAFFGDPVLIRSKS